MLIATVILDLAAPPHQLPILWRLIIIALVAILANVIVLLVRTGSRWLLESTFGSISKAQTLTRFIASTLIFVVWFVAIGVALYELEVPLGTYIASASIIGLAVSFGSQSLVQDVIGGLTLIFGGLLDVGDMVDIGGQTGVIEKIGIRYTELRNVQGAVVSIPNRNVTNVINFPKGYIHAFADVRLPPAAEVQDEAVKRIDRIARAARSQFSGVMIREPSITRMSEPTATHLAPDESPEGTPGAHRERPFLRIKFRIWPGQGGVIENAIRQRLIQNMRTLDPAYQDWMVAVHYRVEPAFTRRAVSALEAFRKRRAKQRDSN